MAMTAKRHHASKTAGRPLKGRTTKYAGRIIADDPAYASPVVPSLLIQHHVTHVVHGSGAALDWCREMLLHFAANMRFQKMKPPRALRIAVATVRDDTADALASLVETTGIVPEHRFAIHRLAFDWNDTMRDPVELARVIRANNSDVLLAECGRDALRLVRRHLGDLSVPILTPCDPQPDDATAITLRLHDDMTFEIEGQENAK